MPSDAAGGGPSFSTRYKRYVLGAATLVYTLNLVDRGLVTLLLQPIKVELHLSDTQLGFITGIAFGLFYSVLGLPIARLADRGNRVKIASVAMGLWAGAVMLSVFIGNFVQLVLARVAAAVGEAGCMPPTYSLVGDYYPRPAERTRAIAVYMLGGPFASILSYILGGRLNEAFGWRMTFFLAGIPALLVAVLIRTTIAEPRKYAPPSRSCEVHSMSMMETLKVLWQRRSTRHLIMAIILLWTMGLGLNPWYAAFLMRSHGMGTAELGMWLGLIFGFGGIAGILLGGYLGSRPLAQDERGQLRVSAVMIGSLVPWYVLFLLVPGKAASLLALLPLAVTLGVFIGPTFALLQRLVVDEMRATTLAVVMLLAHLIGMGFGPQVVGILSDSLHPTFGSDSLRYAMLTLSFLSLWAAYHFWQAGRTVKEDLHAVGGRLATDVRGLEVRGIQSFK